MPETRSTSAGEQPVPAGFRLRPDPGSRLLAGRTVLVGGSPTRLLRLTAAGADQVADLWAGAPVPDDLRARALARRLLDAGIAHPALDAELPAGPADVTVVIPVRDRHAELARCLAALNRTGPGLPIIVVDDGSADPAAIAAIAAAAGARVLRRPVNGGAGAARNMGLAAARTPLVAFVDSDCVPRPGWLDTLLPHFADPAVGVVAPRIVPHAESRTWLGRYEAVSSTLDLGAREGIVRPGSHVPYVPGAALVVRKAAAGAGFPEHLPAGEDIDFIWRLAASGWRVRYEPRAEVGHQHRDRLGPWFGRRRQYGTSAAVLELTHPGAVRPLYLSGWTALAWLTAAAGHPVVAATVTGTATALLARRISQVTGERWPLPGGIRKPDSAMPERAGTARRLAGEPARAAGDPAGTAWRLAARLAGGGTLAAARPLGSAISRTWWPVALPAAVAMPRLRLPLAALVLAPPLLDWLGRRPPLDPARFTAARLLDDIGYSIGVWQGCAHQHTVRPLLPTIGKAGQRHEVIYAVRARIRRGR
jgi:mycofactocin system glycosyltransferase